MDEKPFSQQCGRPRFRIRSLLLVGVFVLGYLLYGPSLSGNQDYSSPVYNHKNVLIKYWPGFQGLRHIVFFGDSYTSTRFLPQNAQPSRENPFGNPPFPGNVSHKRPLWSDYLVATYNESFLTAVNLAWGGATVNDELVVPFIDVIEGLNRQVKNNYLGKYAPMRNSSEVFSWQSHDTLFVFWFGINDVNGAWLWENRTDVWRRDLETYKENVEKVYQTGARNFLFFNVPPIERAPITLALNEELQARKKAEVANWNNEVATIVHDFTKLHNDTTTFWWDANRSYNEVLDNPCLYPETCELRDLTTACPVYAKKLVVETLENWDQNEPDCPLPLRDHFWMDELHHGYHMHDVTAQGVVKMLSRTQRNYWVQDKGMLI